MVQTLRMDFYAECALWFCEEKVQNVNVNKKIMLHNLKKKDLDRLVSESAN